jgi:5-methylcytosine-specific restriction endonuclease McrA
MMQICTYCKIEKPLTEFHKNRSRPSGLHSNCKTCKGVSVCKSACKYKNTEYGLLTHKISEIFTPSAIRKRGFVPNCTKDEIKKYFFEYVKIHGSNCFYCKEPWTYTFNTYIPGNGRNTDKGKSRKRSIKNLSIDRLDSSKTYGIDNIVFCCTECNLSKKDISIKLIKRLHEIITERNL